MITNAQLAKLRREYSKIKVVNPEDEGYRKVCAMLDKMDDNQLSQLANAKINWISSLANNRIIKRKYVKIF